MLLLRAEWQMYEMFELFTEISALVADLRKDKYLIFFLQRYSSHHPPHYLANTPTMQIHILPALALVLSFGMNFASATCLTDRTEGGDCDTVGDMACSKNACEVVSWKIHSPSFQAPLGINSG